MCGGSVRLKEFSRREEGSRLRPSANDGFLPSLQSEPRVRLVMAQHMLRDIQGILNRLEVSEFPTPPTPPGGGT